MSETGEVILVEETIVQVPEQNENAYETTEENHQEQDEEIYEMNEDNLEEDGEHHDTEVVEDHEEHQEIGEEYQEIVEEHQEIVEEHNESTEEHHESTEKHHESTEEHHETTGEHKKLTSSKSLPAKKFVSPKPLTKSASTTTPKKVSKTPTPTKTTTSKPTPAKPAVAKAPAKAPQTATKTPTKVTVTAQVTEDDAKRGRQPVSVKKGRTRSRARRACLDDCVLWHRINARDSTSDARKPQKIAKTERMRHIHEVFMENDIPDLSAEQLVTLLERFESIDERCHCAFLATLLLKSEKESRDSALWIEAGLDQVLADHCSGILRAFDMQGDIVEHRRICAEADTIASNYYAEAKKLMKVDKKEQDGAAVISKLEATQEAKEPTAEQSISARAKFSSAVELSNSLEVFSGQIDSHFGASLNTLTDEAKEFLRVGIQKPLSVIRQSLPECQLNVEECERLAGHSAQIAEEAAKLLEGYTPPLTADEKKKKMLERKAKADQEYLERLKKNSPAEKKSSGTTKPAKK